MDLLAELAECVKRVHLLSDACDRWLRDPDDPTRYDVGPRAEDVAVSYSRETEDGRTVRRKERLAVLLARVEEQAGATVELVQIRHADPRELLLKSYDRLESRLTLVGKLLAKLPQEGTINVHLSPEWIGVRSLLLVALAPYPEVRAAAAAALEEAEAVREGMLS